VKSAGTENQARIKVNEKLVTWADLIFVMEKKHKERLGEKFRALVDSKKIVILDIQDDFKYMDPELIEILKVSVTPHLS